jgi:hypothetical protein
MHNGGGEPRKDTPMLVEEFSIPATAYYCAASLKRQGDQLFTCIYAHEPAARHSTIKLEKRVTQADEPKLKLLVAKVLLL